MKLVKAAAEHVGPLFIRTGRLKAPVIYEPDQEFTIGKAIELMEGSDVTLIATGSAGGGIHSRRRRLWKPKAFPRG